LSDASSGGALVAAERLLLAALLIAPWPYGCAGDTARYLLTAVLLAAAALWCIALHRAGAGLPSLAPVALGLPGLALLQLGLGRSAAPAATGEAFLVLAGMVAVLLFWADRARDRHAARRLALVVLAACGAQAAFGAAQWSLAPGTVYGHVAPQLTSPFGSYVNHNHFAGLVEMGAVLALGLAIGAWRRAGGPTPQAVGFAGLCLGLAAAHLASRSRGGLLALACGMALAAILAAASPADRRGPSGWRPIALAAALALAFGLAVVPRGTRAHLATLLVGPADASGQYRLDTSAATLRAAAARPLLGWGLGAYADAVAPFKRAHGEVRTSHAESDLLELLAEGGIVGIGLVLFLARQGARALAQRLATGHDPLRRAMAFGAAAACGALAAHSLVDFNLRLPANALSFASLAGLAAAPRQEGARHRGALVLACLCGVLAVLSAWRALGTWDLDRALGHSLAPQRRAALDGVLGRHPYLADAWRARATLSWAGTAGSGSGPLARVRLARAEDDLGRALSLRPRWGEAWADLAAVRALRGDAAGATEALERARALDPTHPGIRIRSE
jgi:O-antigen ligase